MFIHWENCNRIHKGNNYINIRRMHTILCTPLLPRTPMVWLGTCSFSRSKQPRRRNWKSLPIKNTWFLAYWRKTWSCDTVFRKTTSLECSGKFFLLGCNWERISVTVPIEALIHPLYVIPDSGGERVIYFAVLPKHNWSRFFGERIIITNNI